MEQQQQWRSLKIDRPDHGVAKLSLHRPLRSNAFDPSLFSELPLAISYLDSCTDVRVIILSASGKNFCAGIDLSLLLSQQNPGYGEKEEGKDEDGLRGGATYREKNLRFIKNLQESFSSIESCRKPVIAAIHGACIGAGVDLIAACDLR